MLIHPLNIILKVLREPKLKFVESIIIKELDKLTGDESEIINLQHFIENLRSDILFQLIEGLRCPGEGVS